MTDKLGPLPEPAGSTEIACGWAPGGGVELMYVDGFTADQMHTYAAEQVAAERERCAKLCDAKFIQHSATGFPREASAARALAALIRA